MTGLPRLNPANSSFEAPLALEVVRYTVMVAATDFKGNAALRDPKTTR